MDCGRAGWMERGAIRDDEGRRIGGWNTDLKRRSPGSINRARAPDPNEPPEGVSLIIATDEDQANVQLPPASPVSPPLSIRDFMEGSFTGDGPTISLLWFNVSEHTLLVSIKTGVSVSREMSQR
jgi:hypothetical protein